MINVIKNSLISTFDIESVNIDELYTGYIIECIDVNNNQEKARVYDIETSISNGHVVINDYCNLDEMQIYLYS